MSDLEVSISKMTPEQKAAGLRQAGQRVMEAGKAKFDNADLQEQYKIRLLVAGMEPDEVRAVSWAQSLGLDLTLAKRDGARWQFGHHDLTRSADSTKLFVFWVFMHTGTLQPGGKQVEDVVTHIEQGTKL